ncbi:MULTISPECIES: Spo0B domain-containing protein [Lysinibacillus]|uniref:Spo0B domain-containing protein n=1 Tax=Lysinibacillus TaxID=400634 RepID=UPI000506362B|nr:MULTISPECIES: Spo0B domain-containing protein [Lysinibacillus]KAB0443355.1 sporulation protein [Lysinibacillus fusiformis]KGA81348.1 sporulation protein [Lysinibacillus fusiformis]MCT6926700.1 Spo0B domain-containing protein [Lysinibacillus fusiformis]MCT6931037.1 Spo0B domain-containing protein [Lysinibacillus fusiformis]UXJ67691.1 Spo0B domain-containing protein [Lysinibacillus fusiformis]
MNNQSLTISEVLRFANHDFVNQLQLIRMNLDLGRVDESKELIQHFSEQLRVFSILNRLQLPQTIEWFQTAGWRFPSLAWKINSDIKKPVTNKIDQEIVDYLNKTVMHVYDTLDPFTEQILTLDVRVDDHTFAVTFTLNGLWSADAFTEKGLKQFNIQTIEQTNTRWQYVLSANRE